MIDVEHHAGRGGLADRYQRSGSARHMWSVRARARTDETTHRHGQRPRPRWMTRWLPATHGRGSQPGRLSRLGSTAAILCPAGRLCTRSWPCRRSRPAVPSVRTAQQASRPTILPIRGKAEALNAVGWRHGLLGAYQPRASNARDRRGRRLEGRLAARVPHGLGGSPRRAAPHDVVRVAVPWTSLRPDTASQRTVLALLPR